MSITPITPELLLEKGFEKRITPEGIFYTKGKVSLAHNFFWIPCRTEVGRTPGLPIRHVTTYEELQQLAKEDGIEI